MPFLSGNSNAGKARLSLTAHPSALWADETYTPSQDYTPSLERARRVEPLNHGCGNPRCSTSWAKPWKNRRRPIFEDRWGCGPRCLETMIEGAVRREFGDGVAETAWEPHRHRVPLGLVMLAHGWITHPQLQRALEGQREAGSGKIGFWLQQECGLPRETVTRGLSVQWSCPVLAAGGFAPKAMALVMPRLFVQEFGLVPLRIAGPRTLYLASEDRLDASAAFSLQTMSGLQVESGLLPGDVLASTRERLLDSSFVKVTEENVRNSEQMTTRIAAILAGAQPVRARLVRVHQYYWLRTWLEAEEHQGTGTVPSSTEDVLDTIFTMGVQVKAQAPTVLKLQSAQAVETQVAVELPAPVAALPIPEAAEVEARLQPLVHIASPEPSGQVEMVTCEGENITLCDAEPIFPTAIEEKNFADFTSLVHVPASLPALPRGGAFQPIPLSPIAFIKQSLPEPLEEQPALAPRALPGVTRLALATPGASSTGLAISAPAFLTTTSVEAVATAPEQLAIATPVCLALGVPDPTPASLAVIPSAALAVNACSTLAVTTPGALAVVARDATALAVVPQDCTALAMSDSAATGLALTTAACLDLLAPASKEVSLAFLDGPGVALSIGRTAPGSLGLATLADVNTVASSALAIVADHELEVGAVKLLAIGNSHALAIGPALPGSRTLEGPTLSRAGLLAFPVPQPEVDFATSLDSWTEPAPSVLLVFFRWILSVLLFWKD